MIYWVSWYIWEAGRWERVARICHTDEEKQELVDALAAAGTRATIERF